MAPQTAAAAPSRNTILAAAEAALGCVDIHGAATVSASTPLDADLHPLDSELAIEIRAMFLAHWNMDASQADARMAQFNYGHAVAALPVPAPSADFQFNPLSISA